MQFGFLSHKMELETDSFLIKTIADIDSFIESLEKDEAIFDNWIYPPFEIKNDKPVKVSDAYHLRATHELVIKGSVDKELEKHIILLFGFLNGLRFYPEGYSFFYKTPYKIRELVGFFATEEEKKYIINNEISNYNIRNAEQNKLIFAAINWFLFGQCYIYEFERFDAQYRVLDCIYAYMRIDGLGHVRHWQRIQSICKEKKIPIPSWARELSSNEKKSYISELRNELYHEAKFAGEPIGYSLPEGNIVFELTLLNERLLLLILGCESEILHQSVENFRAKYGLDLNLYRNSLLTRKPSPCGEGAQ